MDYRGHSFLAHVLGLQVGSRVWDSKAVGSRFGSFLTLNLTPCILNPKT